MIVDGFTAERMLEIENTTVVDGEVVGDDLILQRRDAVEINAGNVRGPDGPDGGWVLPMQVNGTLSAMTHVTAVYISKTANYRVRATCRDRGTGTTLVVNLQVDGATALGGADRPSIAAGSGLGSDQSDGLLALTAGQFITGIIIESVGTGWTTLVVQLIQEV